MTTHVSYRNALKAGLMAPDDFDTTGSLFLAYAYPEHAMWLEDWVSFFLINFFFLHATIYLFCRFAGIVPAKRDRFRSKMDQFLASFAAFVIIKGHVVGCFSALPFLNRHVVSPLVVALTAIFGAFVTALSVLFEAFVAALSVLFVALDATLSALYEEFITNVSAFVDDILTTLRVVTWIVKNTDAALFILIIAIILALVVATLAHAFWTDPFRSRPRIACYHCNRQIRPSALHLFALAATGTKTTCSHACAAEVAFSRELHYASCHPDVDVNFRVCVARGVVGGLEKWEKLEEAESAWVEKGVMSRERWEKNRALRAPFRAELAFRHNLWLLGALKAIIVGLFVAAAWQGTWEVLEEVFEMLWEASCLSWQLVACFCWFGWLICGVFGEFFGF
ncbi:uncharacterized protein BDZ99DRAFT_576265 [Mytilinidion resinicola]|uniref:Uncharacterized protein n=1 Tax=Mytilinidion resinicola TaxID=574789 RepID=A0A6A6Y3H2_9PEZI|nr:uncharacterized protein BDZ99DRAFT_576265 [Mytilinidion resinicola]KAF2803381.1 hypothetical protein BDZ99DRAFT_576265 [Mytilinidion resinicola]